MRGILRFGTVFCALVLAAAMVPPPAGAVAPTPKPIAHVTVIDAASGEPVSAAWVDAYYVHPCSGDELWTGESYTDSDGTCTVYDHEGFGAGRYVIKVWSRQVYGEDPFEKTIEWDGQNPVNVTFELRPPAAIAVVRVTKAATGEPFEGAWAGASFVDPKTGETYLTAEAYTASDGTARLSDSRRYGPGTYIVVVRADGFVLQKQTVSWDGERTAGLDFSLEPAKLIARVTVVDASTRNPVEHAFVAAQCATAATPEDALADFGQTGSDGKLALFDEGGYGAGSYVISVEKSGYACQRMLVMWDGENACDVTFDLRPPKPIATVRVTDRGTGEPIVGVEVDAYYIDRQTSALWWASFEWTSAGGTCTLYDDESFGAGRYLIRVDTQGYYPLERSIVWDGEHAVAVSFPLQRKPIDCVSVAGADRVSTALAASKMAFANGGAEAVVVATAYNWPDALGGAALAGAAGGPVLLTPRDSLPDAVAAEIARLGAKKAYVLGGTGAVSSDVEAALKSQLGQDNVERLWGADRYETARKVAAECVELKGAAYDGTAFLATGANYPDALGASPAAAAKGWPIFLVDPRAGADAALVSAMQNAGVKQAIVLGGTGAVSDSVETDVGSKVRCCTDRWAGADRYSTAAVIADRSVRAGLAYDGGLGIATGEDFPDALAAGPLLARSGSVLLLTRSASLPEPTRAALVTHKLEIPVVRFFGGPGAISQAARDAVLQALK